MGTSVVSNNSISTISGYRIFGEGRLGDNGEDGAYPEVRTGASTSSMVTCRKVWDEDDGFDSGTVAVSLTLMAGGGTGGVQLAVAGGTTDPLTYNSGAYSTVTSVKVRAYLTAGHTFVKASGVSAVFTGGSPETVSYGSDLTVDAYTLDDPVAKEVILTITPGSNSHTGVTVTLNMELKYDPDYPPSEDSMKVQVFAFGNPP